MPEKANVTSLEAIEDFRAQLLIYISKARPALEEVSSDVLRLRLWLENDQRMALESLARRRRKEFDQETGMIIGVYGINHNAGPWAHATAFHRRRTGGQGGAQEMAFFDGNGGEFHLEPSSDTGAEIEQYLQRHYSGIDGKTCYAIKDYVLYRVTAS